MCVWGGTFARHNAFLQLVFLRTTQNHSVLPRLIRISYLTAEVTLDGSQWMAVVQIEQIIKRGFVLDFETK